MKIRILNWLLIVDILTILLVFLVILVPSGIVHILLGLPFLLFFPGYTLMEALFVKKEGLDGIERIGLNIGLSIAIVALIGFGLNYTTWGIGVESILCSVAAFIILMSAISLIRTSRSSRGIEYTVEWNVRLLGWKGNFFGKSLTILVTILLLCTIGILGYTVAAPKVGEEFTEFYILGINGEAQDYPTLFTTENGRVTRVIYGSSAYTTDSEWGEVTLGIVNREQEKVTYSIMIKLDDEVVSIDYEGTTTSQIKSIQLQQDEVWEQRIGFSPQHTGTNQKVEFILFSGDGATIKDTLHLWINVD